MEPHHDQPQLVRSQFHDQYGHDVAHHHTGEGGDEHEHEKKSVLKKVKAKAKKLKDSLITKHGHDHDNAIIPDDHDLDQEDDDDEQIVYDHGVHGGTGTGTGRRAAGVIGGTNLPLQQPESLAQPPATTVAVVEKYVETSNYYYPKHKNTSTTDTGTRSDPSKTLLYGTSGEGQVQPRVNLERPRGGLEEDPAAPNNIHLPANYQTKVTDPTQAGGEELDVSPILESFERVCVNDYGGGRSKPAREDLNLYSTGTHNQFSPEPFSQTQNQHYSGTHNQSDHHSNIPYTGTGTHNLFSSTHHHDHDSDPILPVTGTQPSDTYNTQENEYSDSPGFVEFAPEKVLPRESSVPVEYSREWPQEEEASHNGSSSSYTDKISSAAISAKNAVASKLGYGGEGDKPLTATATEYGKKVYEKVAGTGSAVMAKIPGTEYVTDKLRPGEEDRALSEVISEALQKRKEETGKKEEDPMGKEELERVAERVTESEEVKARLGTGEDKVGSKVAENYVNSKESGVVNKLTGAIGSWFATSDPTDHNSPPTRPRPGK